MAGTYGTFPVPGSSSTVATDSRNTGGDAKSTHSVERSASVRDQELARLSPHTEELPTVGQDIGVTRIESLYRVFGTGNGKTPIWLFYVSIGLISYAYSLSSNTVSNFFSFATSAFGKHSILGTVEVAIYVLGAVGTCPSLTLDQFRPALCGVANSSLTCSEAIYRQTVRHHLSSDYVLDFPDFLRPRLYCCRFCSECQRTRGWYVQPATVPCGTTADLC